MRKLFWTIGMGAALCGGCASIMREPRTAAVASVADCKYDIETLAGSPTWKPEEGAVCTDDHVTIIRFPYVQPMRNAPNLFVIDDAKKDLTQYSHLGQRYRISAPIERAELRAGDGDHAEVVRIARKSK